MREAMKPAMDVLKPESTTLRKLRLKYNVSLRSVADEMGVDETYLEKMEDSGDCKASEFRRYCAAIGGNARLSVKMSDGQLYLADLGYRPQHRELPEVHGVDMPEMPKTSEDVADFERKLKQIEEHAYEVTSDRASDKRERALGFSARNSAALLRKVMRSYLPRVQALEAVFDYLDKKSDLSDEETALMNNIADLLDLEE